MLCFITKLNIEHEIDTYGDIKSRRLLKHLDKCCKCSSYYRYLRNFEHQLKSKPAYQIDDLPMKTIHYNIRNAISSKIIKNKLPQKQHKKLYTYTLPAAVIIILLIAVSLMFTNVISQNSKTDDQQKLVQLVSGGNSMANQLNRLINMPEDSVESEVNSLISDARKLISFLDRCTPAPRLEEKPQNGM